MSESKLAELLRQTWASPVFGDSYPAVDSPEYAGFLAQVKDVHHHFTTALKPILERGVPDAPAGEIAAIMKQIGPKSTAFCAAIAAGEVNDVCRLSAAAVSISLVYWADQCMDRGDEAMLAAVRRLTGPNPSPGSLTPLAQARCRGVQAIGNQIERISRPEDSPFLRRFVFQDTLYQEAHITRLSRLYKNEYLDGEDDRPFWRRHADRIAHLSINNGAFIYVTAAIYAIYRCHDPQLPALREIVANEEIMAFMRGPGNSIIRLLDDLGDRRIDSGAHPEWGKFYLNLFNQPAAPLLQAFMRQSGIRDQQLIDCLADAFQSGDAARYQTIVDAYIAFLRQQREALPAPAQERYALFLKLAQRVLEAGYVNSVGDIELAER